MADTHPADVPTGWQSRGSTRVLFRRFAFERYALARDFVEAVSALAERDGVHPQNINFGSTYVNVTLDARPDGSADADLARRIDALLSGEGG